MTDHELRFQVRGPAFNLMKDPYVPFSGVRGAAIPCRFTCEVGDLDADCTAHLQIEVTEGRPRLRSFTLTASGDNLLTPTAIRNLPLGTYLDLAVARAVARTSKVTEEVTKIAPFATFDEAADVMKAGRAVRRRQQPVTDERLEEAAEAYREAPPRQKTQHVADELGVGYGYARQLVHKARKAGKLP